MPTSVAAKENTEHLFTKDFLTDKHASTTHEVLNQPSALQDFNLFSSDKALTSLTRQEGAQWATNTLTAFGEKIGTANYLELGQLANENKPQFFSHDRFGHRIDLVRFHPSYHTLMQTAIENGLHASPWTDPQAGAHVARAAQTYMHTQVEAAHGCPITMTFASIPTLRQQPELAAYWEPKITARHYDPANITAEQKSGITIGMAMTEKQGGSDVRANTTRALPIGKEGPAQVYELVGHKYFVSAPMCDAFLVLAQAPRGLSCFLLPRWRPDGSKNPMQLQQLKNKMGNVANASSETELRGALAWMVGEEGRGVSTIIQMVAMTRFDCMVGSSAGMRMAVAQAIHHCSERAAFGKKLIDQPLMQNVLADLAIESEASLTMSMRLAHSLDNAADPHEQQLVRLVTAIGKYWICKRAPNHAYEAMECIGGSGVMEDCMMPRLFRESPINSIWEGSGNIQCLDTLRAMSKTPDVKESFFAELGAQKGKNAAYDQYLTRLQKQLSDPQQIEYRARETTDMMALAFQGACMLRTDNQLMAEAFCQSRLLQSGPHNYGTLPKGMDVRAIIHRASPH